MRQHACMHTKDLYSKTILVHTNDKNNKTHFKALLDYRVFKCYALVEQKLINTKIKSKRRPLTTHVVNTFRLMMQELTNKNFHSQFYKCTN